MKIKLALASLAALSMLSTLGISHSTTTTVTREYFGNTDVFPYALCQTETLPGTDVAPGETTGKNTGSVCVPVNGADTIKISKVADEVSGGHVELSYIFLDADGNGVGDISDLEAVDDPEAYVDDTCDTCGTTCGAMTHEIIVPSAARSFYVWVHGVTDASINTAVEAGCNDPSAIGTHGTLSFQIVK